MSLDVPSLKESKDFLNALYDNVTSAIFVADGGARIQSFNDGLKALFYKEEDDILHELCGNAIGCSFQVEETKDCGTTSNCGFCALRSAILWSVGEGAPVYKERMNRDFYIEGKRIPKRLVFSAKPVSFEGERMALVIFDDVTELEAARMAQARRAARLKAALKRSSRELVEASREVSRCLEEKEALVKELEHRIGNGLQLISSIVHLELSRCEDDGAWQLERRIDAMRHVYRELRYEAGSAVVDFGPCIRGIVEGDTHKNGDRVVVVDPSSLEKIGVVSLDKAMCAALLCAELLMLAGSTGRRGAIEARFAREGADLVMELAEEAANGLGAALDDPLVSALSDQARCCREAIPGGGARLRIPLR